MHISDNEFDKISRLCKLNFHEHEKKEFRHEIEQIIQYLSIIKEVDTEQTTAMVVPFENKQPVRQDEITYSDFIETKALLNAPFKKNGYFAVPKIIKE